MARKKLPAIDLFVDATNFWRCAALVGRHNYYYQAIAFEAFSLELHLKSLHRINKCSIKEIKDLSHHIRKSFEYLTTRDQDAIRERFLQVIAAPNRFDCMLSTAQGKSLDIDTVLDRAENLFAEARYRAEGALYNRSRVKKGLSDGISALIRTIHDITLEKRPKWRDHPQLAQHFSMPPPKSGRWQS